MKAPILLGSAALACVFAGAAMAHTDGRRAYSIPAAQAGGIAAVAALFPLLDIGQQAIQALTQGGDDQSDYGQGYDQSDYGQGYPQDAYGDPQTDEYYGGYGNGYASDYGDPGGAQSYGPGPYYDTGQGGPPYGQGYRSDEGAAYGDPQTDYYGGAPNYYGGAPNGYGYGPGSDADSSMYEQSMYQYQRSQALYQAELARYDGMLGGYYGSGGGYYGSSYGW